MLNISSLVFHSPVSSLTRLLIFYNIHKKQFSAKHSAVVGVVGSPADGFLICLQSPPGPEGNEDFHIHTGKQTADARF